MYGTILCGATRELDIVVIQLGEIIFIIMSNKVQFAMHCIAVRIGLKLPSAGDFCANIYACAALALFGHL